MKIRFCLLLLCTLVVAGNASAQEHNWSSVETPTSGLFRVSLDRNFNVLPNGNIEYWKKTEYNGFTTLDLFEVDCVKKQRRLLKSTRTDRSGTVVARSDTAEGWSGIDESSNGVVAGMVCQSQVKVKPPVVKKKPVKKSRKKP